MDTLFVAAATSLPELVVTVSAACSGAVDMATGNLLGSNLFNVLVIAIDDLLYGNGPLLSKVSTIHGSTATVAVLMTIIAVVCLAFDHRANRRSTLRWASAALLALYAMNVSVVFYHEP